MPVIYIITFDTPEGIGGWAPSVADSEWVRELVEYTTANSNVTVSADGSKVVYIFDNESALNTFLDRFRLNDPEMLSDTADWKSAHGVRYINEFYSTTAISNTGVIS